jgi:hypothetical protein
MTIFGVLQFQRGSNEIKLETRDVVATPRPHHARAALHAATRQTPLAPAYGPWTLRGRPCVLGGLRTTRRPCTASRREPPVGQTPRAARRRCQPRLARGRGQLAVPAGAKCSPSPRFPFLICSETKRVAWLVTSVRRTPLSVAEELHPPLATTVPGPHLSRPTAPLHPPQPPARLHCEHARWRRG